MSEKSVITLTGNMFINPTLPDDFYKMETGDIVIDNGWPHVVVDAGEEQGKRIAAFMMPYGWKVVARKEDKE